MYTRLLNIWDNFRSNFWFVPAVMMCAAAILAIVLVRLDAAIGPQLIQKYPAFELSPAAARAILSSIVGAMVTSTGVVFSITIVALSLASSQFGSRLIRTYRNRKSTQFTLGFFVATSLFCILVLATIRELEQNPFVPATSVMTGIGLTVVCLGTLIYYIDDISRAIQAPNVIQSSANDLHTAIARLYPDSKENSNTGPIAAGADAKEPDPVSRHLEDPIRTVNCDRIGYVQAIEYESIMNLATENDLIIQSLIRPGDFVQPGRPLAHLFASCSATGSRLDDEGLEQLAERLRGFLITGIDRKPTQDLRYAFNELVEIAVRALSPGINDPFTALNCIDRIQAALSELGQRKLPSANRMDREKNIRIVAEPIPFSAYIDGTLRVIEHYAADSPIVNNRIQAALRAVESAVRN